MPQAKKTAPRTKSKGAEPVERLDGAIAAAQDALKDLRRDLSRGRRDLVQDVDKTLKDARANLRRVRRTLVDDLEKVGQSIGGPATSKPRAARGSSGARRTSSTKARSRAKA
jgi:ABC-type transporter Mla subunit MlaD